MSSRILYLLLSLMLCLSCQSEHPQVKAAYDLIERVAMATESSSPLN